MGEELTKPDGWVEDEEKAHRMANVEHPIRDRANATTNESLKSKIIKNAEQKGEVEGELIDNIHKAAEAMIEEALTEGSCSFDFRKTPGVRSADMTRVKDEIEKILDNSDYKKERFKIEVDQIGSTGPTLMLRIE